jgi:phosphoribosylaminoimidazole-succinocarboxamide synthase
VLTQTARFWFEHTADICPNHVLSYPDPNVVIAKRLTILPVEIVVRGLSGRHHGHLDPHACTRPASASMYGMTLPDGMRDNERLPAPIITPTSKEFDGGHDAPLTPDGHPLPRPADGDAVGAAEQLRFGAVRARPEDGRRARVDPGRHEIRIRRGPMPGPASCWPMKSTRPTAAATGAPPASRQRFEAGEKPESFDKDFVRSWVAARCDPYHDEIPEIPEELILGTAAVYIEAYETITGQRFALPEGPEDVLARVRENLRPYFKK